MNQVDITGVLNRLLRILCRSLSMYLEQARPWSRSTDGRAQVLLARLRADRRLMAGRVAQTIAEHGGRPDPGAFPIEFTGINDVAMAYLVSELIDCQRRDIAAIQRCVAELAHAPQERCLAEEVLGNAQGHLEILEGLKMDE